VSRRIVLTLLLTLGLSAASFAQKIGPPKLTPAPLTEAQQSLLREGVALHEQRDYDGAIRKYEEALKENTDNPTALYEIAYAYYAKGDRPKALEYAYRAAQYKSDSLGIIYVLIGNVLDTQGDPEKAVEIYKAGIKLAPEEAQLHFNLAVTYSGLGKLDEAKKSVKQSLSRNPKHPTSHLLLASLFQRGGYQTPALFAALRFLVLEPQSERAEGALQVAQKIMQGSVTPGKNSNEISIFLNMSAKTDEGDFSSIDLMLGLSKAVSMTKENKEENKNKTEAQLLVEQFNSVFAVLSELDPKKVEGKFVGRYYMPYFIELKRRNFVEPFVYHTHRRSGLQGVTEWLKDHDARTLEFLVWSKNYKWPPVN